MRWLVPAGSRAARHHGAAYRRYLLLANRCEVRGAHPELTQPRKDETEVTVTGRIVCTPESRINQHRREVPSTDAADIETESGKLTTE
jgi:hypothetical protein